MLEPQKNKYFKSYGASVRPQLIFSYPRGHPCYGCPYTFGTSHPSYTMGSKPGNCAWYFYRRLMCNPVPPPTMASVCNNETNAIDQCIEILYQTAERKYGKKYADKLRKRRENSHENPTGVF